MLISRLGNLNSVVLSFFVPWIFWENVGIACYVLDQWGCCNRARQRHCGQRNVSECSDNMCTIFWVLGAGSQVQSQERESMPNGSIHGICMELAMARHVFV